MLENDYRNFPRASNNSPIAKMRIERNITQKELADKLNVTQICVSRYENGDRDIKLSMLRKIAAALDCKVSELIEDE